MIKSRGERKADNLILWWHKNSWDTREINEVMQMTHQEYFLYTEKGILPSDYLQRNKGWKSSDFSNYFRKHLIKNMIWFIFCVRIPAWTRFLKRRLTRKKPTLVRYYTGLGTDEDKQYRIVGPADMMFKLDFQLASSEYVDMKRIPIKSISNVQKYFLRVSRRCK